MRKLLMILAVLSALLTGCVSGGSAPSAQTPETAAPTRPPQTEAPTHSPVTVPTRPVETEPTEPEPEPYTNPLTGEPVPEPVTARPYAVTFNNSQYALPQWGIGQADVLYEMSIEWGSTRCLGIFTDMSQVGKLGPNRSARPYTLSVAMGYDALLHHAGGCSQAYRDLERTGWENLDGVAGPGASYYYHRDQDRLDAGVALEHTMYTTGPEVLAYADYLALTTHRTEPLDFGLRFGAESSAAAGTDARSLTVTFRGGKTTRMTYHPETGLYTLTQFGVEQIDGNNGRALTFRNLIVIGTSIWERTDEKGRIAMELVGSGEGWFACDGKLVPILWSRSGEYAPFTYTLTDGTPLTLGVGKTYIAVIPEGNAVSCQ